MLMKLALRNVRRSVRDYAVYFVTLTLGVAVFYAFNAIGDSRVLFEAQEGAENMFLASGASVFDILAQVMTYFSIVVAVVLGFLVLYANRFVVRARKKAFGHEPTTGFLGGPDGNADRRRACAGGGLGAWLPDFPGNRLRHGGPYRRGNQRLPPAVQRPIRRADPGLFRAHLRRSRLVQCRADFALQACHAAFGQLPQRAHARAQPPHLSDCVRAVVPHLGKGVRRAQHRRTGLLRRALPHRNPVDARRHVGPILVGVGVLHPANPAFAGRVLQGSRHVHHAPDRDESEHCVRIAVGRERPSVLQYRRVLDGL